MALLIQPQKRRESLHARFHAPIQSMLSDCLLPVRVARKIKWMRRASLTAPRLGGLLVEVRSEFREAVNDQIGRIVCELRAAEAVGYATTPRAGVTGRLHVNFGIAYEHDLFGRGAEIAQQDSHPCGVGFFGLETIAAIDVTKVGRQSQSLENLAAETHWFVCKHGHGHAIERG